MADYRIKTIETRGGIDGQAILKRVADSAKLWVMDNRRAGKSSSRLESTGLLAKFAHGASYALLGRMIDLERRISVLEGGKVAKSLDFEVVDELASVLERLEELDRRTQSLQDELAEKGFRYRGYWQAGTKSVRGDAYTHDGSLWFAVRVTSDKPCNESPDWTVMARKGRDAR